MSNSASTPKDYASDVRGHYEELPYPYRDPAQEGTQVYGNDGFSLDALNHYAWAGKRDLRKKGTRVLVAGDGTGDAAVNFAEMLHGTDAQVVAIDLSATSIAIAKERLARRQLSDVVTHHHMSLLDLPASDLGQFDIIECCGVLHHLTDPNAGLAALGSVLKDDGIMTIMVYAQYGRLAVYMVQDLLRRLLKADASRAEKIALAREFLNHVPNSHWLTVKNQDFLADINWPDGSGIYDLLLHTVDRAYTVPQIYDWVAGAGLNVAGFFSDYTDETLYRPESYTPSPVLRAAFLEKSEPERYALGELMHGSITKHHFYATKQKKTPPELSNDMIITYGPMQMMFTGYVVGALETLGKARMGEAVTVAAKPFASALPLTLTKHACTEHLLRHIDCKRTVGDIVTAVSSGMKLPIHDVRSHLAALYQELRSRNLVFLRHKDVAPYRTMAEATARMNGVLGKA
jgi:SAM-dependent methyltransferase